MGQCKPDDRTDPQHRGDAGEARPNEGGRAGGATPAPRPTPTPREDPAKAPVRPG